MIYFYNKDTWKILFRINDSLIEFINPLTNLGPIAPNGLRNRTISFILSRILGLIAIIPNLRSRRFIGINAFIYSNIHLHFFNYNLEENIQAQNRIRRFLQYVNILFNVVYEHQELINRRWQFGLFEEQQYFQLIHRCLTGIRRLFLMLECESNFTREVELWNLVNTAFSEPRSTFLIQLQISQEEIALIGYITQLFNNLNE